MVISGCFLLELSLGFFFVIDVEIMLDNFFLKFVWFVEFFLNIKIKIIIFKKNVI